MRYGSFKKLSLEFRHARTVSREACNQLLPTESDFSDFQMEMISFFQCILHKLNRIFQSQFVQDVGFMSVYGLSTDV